MVRIIHEISPKERRIHFIHPPAISYGERWAKYFKPFQKYKAKAEHRYSKQNNPVLFNEKRVELATYLVKSFMKNPPEWGAIKFNLQK